MHRHDEDLTVMVYSKPKAFGNSATPTKLKIPTTSWANHAGAVVGGGLVVVVEVDVYVLVYVDEPLVKVVVCVIEV